MEPRSRKLTPIKGRGKGPRKTGFKRPNPQSVRTSLIKPERSRSRRCLVEKLPTEILQQILLLSGELNFPRASLLIGWRLSPRSFLIELVLKAFVPTWDNWFGCLRRNVVSYGGWLEDKERFGGDPILQGDIVAAPWFNMNVLHQALNMWIRRHGQGRFYEHSMSDYLASNLGQFKEHETDEVDHVKDAADCFKWECIWYLEPPTITRPDFRRLETHPDIRVPDKLLMGPWNHTAISLLFWLRMNNARVKDDQTWEIIKPGLDCLLDLSANDADFILFCLKDIGAFDCWSPSVEPIDEKRFEGRPLASSRQGHPDHQGGRSVMRQLCAITGHNTKGHWLGRWSGCTDEGLQTLARQDGVEDLVLTTRQQDGYALHSSLLLGSGKC